MEEIESMDQGDMSNHDKKAWTQCKIKIKKSIICEIGSKLENKKIEMWNYILNKKIFHRIKYLNYSWLVFIIYFFWKEYIHADKQFIIFN